MAYFIKFENISKSFKHEQVLKNINFELEQGKIYGFIGRNGSGKTVIFKLLTGLLRPSEGNIYIQDMNLTKAKKFPESLGVLIETPGFIPHYSGLKNLKVLNSISKEKADLDKVKESMKLVGLDPDNPKPVRTYSLGMRQKLGIAQAIMNQPRLLILDEPMNGLDQQSVERMRTFFQQLKEEHGVTILLASHNKDDIDLLCDQLFYINQGTMSTTVEGRS